MSTTTSNYNLIKPALTDAADITAMNQNWDKIDAELHEIHEKVDVAQSQISYGTAEPSGGSNGDVYIQIIE